MDEMIKGTFNVQTKALGDGEVEVIVNSGQLDRHGDILDIKGLDLAFYKQNPVVAWAHNYTAPAIGMAKKIWKTQDGQLKAVIKFAVDEYDFAKTIYGLYKGGFMSAVSIGFIPLDFKEVDGNLVYPKSEMLEFSAVLVGADPRALVTSKALTKTQAESFEKVVKGEMKVQDYKLGKKKEEVKEDKEVTPVLTKQEENTLQEAIQVLQKVLELGKGQENSVDDIPEPIEIAKKALSAVENMKSQPDSPKKHIKVKKVLQIADKSIELAIKQEKDKLSKEINNE